MHDLTGIRRHPEQFPHRKLLELIISGRLSILRKPPTRIAIAGEADYDEHKKWIDWHRDIIFDGERGVLEECLHWFNARYEHEFRSNGDDITPHEQKLRRFVLEELRTTVNAVMVQPAMIESARRFVVVLGEGEHAVGSVKCGVRSSIMSNVVHCVTGLTFRFSLNGRHSLGSISGTASGAKRIWPICGRNCGKLWLVRSLARSLVILFCVALIFCLLRIM